MTRRSEVRIAILEDNLDLQEELTFFFEAKGYRVWGERSAEAFWKRLHATPVDIVLVDIGLPGEDGLSVLEYLRGLGPYGLIVMSARGSREDRLRGMEAGADVYLVKPVNFADLVLAIDQLWQRLRRPASDTEASASAAPASPPGLHGLEGRPPDMQGEAGRDAVALLAAALKEETADTAADRLSLEAALRQRVIAFVEQNIHRPELSPGFITRRFNVSRSHLYRAFASDGGVAKFLRDKRLDVAAQELTRAGASAVSIAELAHRLGFSSGNQFLRAFRSRFGITPSQAREKGSVPGARRPAAR